MKTMKDINLLKENDIYNLILYAIFKFTNDSEYSTISELIYALDKDGLINLCSSFGGCTIKVPTLTELKVFTAAMIVYREMTIKHKNFSEAYSATCLDQSFKKDVLKVYNTVEEVLQTYGQ